MSVINDAIKVIEQKQDETSKEIVASLNMLMALSESKKNNMISSMDERMKHSIENKEIPPSFRLMTKESVHVMSSKGPASGISSGIDLFFNNAEDRWKKGIQNMIEVALNTVLGNASGSSSEDTSYIIALDGKQATSSTEESLVPVRLDISFWTYDLKSIGIIDEAKSAIVYCARKSLIDYSDLNTITIDQMLKNLGMEKALREELIKQIESDKTFNIDKNSNVNLPKNIKKYNVLYKDKHEEIQF